MAYTRVPDPRPGEHPDIVRRDADSAFIPADPANADWQAYQSWLAGGNEPAEPPLPQALED